MKMLSMRVVNRPGNIVSLMARDEDQFIELRSMYPYHGTEMFVRHECGMCEALLRPLPNVVPMNRKYLLDPYEQVERESWVSTPGAFSPEAA